MISLALFIAFILICAVAVGFWVGRMWEQDAEHARRIEAAREQERLARGARS
jgi:hypothetical protein